MKITVRLLVALFDQLSRHDHKDRSTSWEPRRQQYVDHVCSHPCSIQTRPRHADSQSVCGCRYRISLLSAVEQSWQTMKLLSFHKVTSIHKRLALRTSLGGPLSVTTAHNKHQITWRQSLVTSVGRRQKPEMDVFRICLLITTIAGQSNQSSMSITAVFSSLYKSVVTFVENVRSSRVVNSIGSRPTVITWIWAFKYACPFCELARTH